MKRKTLRQRADTASKRAYPEKWGQWAANDRYPFWLGFIARARYERRIRNSRTANRGRA